MPTATLHSGLFNSKTTTEPATKVPIYAHQPTNSALRRFMSVNILGFIGDGERNPRRPYPGRISRVYSSRAGACRGAHIRRTFIHPS